MIIYIEDIFREVNILNWYKGEAVKHNDPEVVFVQSNKEVEDALMYHLRHAVVNVLTLANNNRVKFTCDYIDDTLKFSISPLREGREHLLSLLKETIRVFLVAEIRLLWMMNIRREWADATMRENLLANIRQVMNDATAMGNKVRRRYAYLGI